MNADERSDRLEGLPSYSTGFPASDVCLQGGAMFWEEIRG